MTPIDMGLARRIIDKATDNAWPHEGWGGADYFLWAWLSMQGEQYQDQAESNPVATVVDYLMCTRLDVARPDQATGQARENWEAAAEAVRAEIESGTHPDALTFEIHAFVYETCHGCVRRCLECYDQ